MTVACMRRILVVAAFLGVSWLPMEATPQTEAETRAKGLFAQAMEAYAEGDYDATVEKLSAAYSFFPSPAFLYNLGLTWEKKGIRSRAAEFYSRYLKESGKEDVKLAERIVVLEAAVARETASKAARKKTRAGEVAVASPTRPPVQWDTGKWPDIPVTVVEKKYGEWPWVTVAASGATLVTGIVFASLSRSNYNKANDLSKQANPSPDQVNRLSSLKKTTRTQSIVADVSFGVAVASGVVTLALFLTETGTASDPPEPVVEMGPLLGPDGETGLAVTRHF